MPEKPSFPVIMFMIAATKVFFDVIVFFLTLIIFPLGWVIGIFLGIIYAGVFWTWYFFKPGARHGRAVFKNTLRLAAALGITVIPVVRLLVPEMLIVVWLTHRDEVKAWQKAYSKAEKALEEETKRMLQKQKGTFARMRREAANDNRASARTIADLRKERTRNRREVERIRKQHDLLPKAA